MLRRLLGTLWRRAPKQVRLFTVRLIQPTFTVTAGAVVVDKQGRVLLLKHVFRTGSGWGLPGGFISAGEQPEDAIRRELREEIDMEIDRLELAFVRTLDRARQVEIIFRCRPLGRANPQSIEVRSAEWFPMNGLPRGLSADQQRLIERALKDDR